MIKKFKEFIVEGLWIKGIERSKTNNKRKEELNEFFNYLNNELKWIDLGHPDVLFANVDYPLDIDNEYAFSYHSHRLSFDDIKLISQNLPKNISIMNRKQIEWLKNNCTIRSYNKIKIKCTNDNLSKFIYFKQCESKYDKVMYYLKTLKDDRNPCIQVATVGMYEKPTSLGRTTSKIVWSPDLLTYSIKLVKQKGS